MADVNDAERGLADLDRHQAEDAGMEDAMQITVELTERDILTLRLLADEQKARQLYLEADDFAYRRGFGDEIEGCRARHRILKRICDAAGGPAVVTAAERQEAMIAAIAGIGIAEQAAMRPVSAPTAQTAGPVEPLEV